MKVYNNYQGQDLTCVICAYGECAYLEECIESLERQTVKPNILISTSTPSEFLSSIADKHGLKIKVNPDGGQIKDYNFAMHQGDSKFVMLMHQDEVIDARFVELSLQALGTVKDPQISFTDYLEMHNDVPDKKASKMVIIKRIMLVPLRWRWLGTTRFGKRLIQLMGDPITHPTVICARDKMPEPIFREEFKASMDWDLWERLSKQPGAFVFVPRVLLYHRMNDDNQTAKLFKTTNARYENESAIFRRFWPKPIVKIIMHFYSGAAKYY